MPPSTTAAFRASSRAFSRPFSFSARPSAFNHRPFQRSRARLYSAEAAAQQQPQSWFKRMWDSPIGLKTVHFWAPVMKWALVIAGISDFARPAEKLSTAQNLSLTATGLIWTRWCLIIKPKNYLLAAVNFFLGMVGIVQVSRIAVYNYSLKDSDTLPSAVAKGAEEVKEEVKEATS